MKKIQLPFLLVYTRLVLGPLMIALGFIYGQKLHFLIFLLLLFGLLTDIFDGIIARKLAISSQKLRVMDSKADIVFWISTGLTAWLLWPKVVLSHMAMIALLFVLEGVCYAVSMIKFKKSTCTHAYAAKIWGILLFLSLSDLILFGQARMLFAMCIIVGIIADVENILITLTLKEWAHDVPSIYHALRMRKGKEIKRYRMFNG